MPSRAEMRRTLAERILECIDRCGKVGATSISRQLTERYGMDVTPCEVGKRIRTYPELRGKIVPLDEKYHYCGRGTPPIRYARRE